MKLIGSSRSARSEPETRWTAGERVAYVKGWEAALAVRPELSTHNWLSSEFALVAATLAFGMWAGGYAILHPENVDLERLLAIVGMVSGLAGVYSYQRSQVKRDVIKKEDG